MPLSNRNMTKSHILDASDRQRLVRLCARISGSAATAEDLAQETLLEAWRHLDKLEDPASYWQWLTAIARNVCLRWGHRQGQATARERNPTAEDGAPWTSGELNAGDEGIEVELERQELITFLDRALALLPAETRAVLVQMYVQDFPQSEIAARLRVSERAVEARLQRGKRMLRKLLSTDLRPEAERLGILLPAELRRQPARDGHSDSPQCREQRRAVPGPVVIGRIADRYRYLRIAH